MTGRHWCRLLWWFVVEEREMRVTERMALQRVFGKVFLGCWGEAESGRGPYYSFVCVRLRMKLDRGSFGMEIFVIGARG